MTSFSNDTSDIKEISKIVIQNPLKFHASKLERKCTTPKYYFSLIKTCRIVRNDLADNQISLTQNLKSIL